MNALALDTSISKITVAAKKGENLVSLTLDLGMRQSEKLLPAIDYVLSQAEIAPSELDYTALCSGPGSFTGLRLSFAALKAIEAAHGIPIYAVNSLDYYAAPFMDFGGAILSVIDARKDKFFAKAFFSGKEIISCDDFELSDLMQKLEEFFQEKNSQEKKSNGKERREEIFVAGEAETFLEACARRNFLQEKKLLWAKGETANLKSLFDLAEEKIAHNESRILEYEGPQYFRASEAELKTATK
ncbi:MAG: tRNA (adenosine(37)-N6)-threonylcarbamoyltransferase complex dimerization subunit type 1 TsaB [Treponemataceae bacterium]|nr:tRNA (adenosine(37)-N6)-threonylcarbamoyltransferase complex dimerization subunit type 1 TsaB [Treponemataceae bacterium]